MNELALDPVQKLPRIADGEGWVRKIKLHRTLNDEVESIHITLLEDESYLRLLEAVYDEQAVEGSLSADNVMAAARIREAATKRGSSLGQEKLATISKALGVVMRRYGVSRKDRRNMVGGQTVPADSNGE